MKKKMTKRLVYYSLPSGDIMYGGQEYDYNLPDSAILGSIHEVGKTAWLPTNWIGPGDKWENELWLLVPDENNPKVKYPTYRILVEVFYQDQKMWYDSAREVIKRIFRI